MAPKISGAELLSSIRQALGGRSSKGVAVALLVIATVSLFLLPVPREALDLLLAANIILSLIILIRSLFATEATQLAAFPVIVVLTTLFRLSLNVSSTRLILLSGEQGLDVAGRVIEAFGTFVVSGNFVVGAIVFAVIALVNFMVITRGSARVAEVAARFTLDALPGRQLAIDSDLRAGTISREEAQQRRNHLTHESHFFGAMDGAMRFVQGDAIAALLIVFVNAAGGVALGLGRGMTFQNAVQNFGVLAIGDGLVSILPALLISVAAGMVVTSVTRRSSGQNTGQVVAAIFTEPQSIAIAALGAIFISLIPGFPFLPFFVIGVILLAAVFFQAKRGLKSGEEEAAAEAASGPEFNGAGEAAIVEAGEELLAELSEGGADLFGQAYLRRRSEIYESRGVVLNPARLRPGAALEPRGYRVLLRGRQVRAGTVPANAIFAAGSPAVLSALGGAVIAAAGHPLDGRACCWLEEQPRIRAMGSKLSAEMLSAAGFLAAEVSGSLLALIEEFFGVDETKRLVKGLQLEHPHLVDEVFDGKLMSPVEFSEILKRLLRERVSIRDLKLILEGAAAFVCTHPAGEDRQEWLNELHRHLRLVTARSIVADIVAPGDKLRVFLLSPEAEEQFRDAVGDWDNPLMKPPLAPEFETTLRESARRMFAPVFERGALPVVLVCSGDIRTAVDDFLSRQNSTSEWYRTIAFEELTGRFAPETVGILSV